MTHVIGMFQVEDFAVWKSGFDRGAAMRESGGMKSYQVFRVVNDPNQVVMISEFDDADTARRFLQSEELKQAHRRSGAVGEITLHFLEEIEKGAD